MSSLLSSSARYFAYGHSDNSTYHGTDEAAKYTADIATLYTAGRFSKFSTFTPTYTTPYSTADITAG